MGSKTYTPTPSTQHTLEKFVFAKRVQRSLEMRHLSEKIFENKLWRKSVRSVECEANDQSSIQTRTFSIYFEKRKSKYCHTRTLDDRMTFQNWCVSVISNKVTLDTHTAELCIFQNCCLTHECITNGILLFSI